MGDTHGKKLAEPEPQDSGASPRKQTVSASAPNSPALTNGGARPKPVKPQSMEDACRSVSLRRFKGGGGSGSQSSFASGTARRCVSVDDHIGRFNRDIDFDNEPDSPDGDFDRNLYGDYRGPSRRFKTTSVPASILKKKDPRVTIRQHYYPEGGWGWVVCVCAFFAQALSTGLLLSYGVLYVEVLRQFGSHRKVEAMWLGGVSLAFGLFLSPVIVAVCRQKSTRLTAVFGGLVSALGCLFTSFASQFHQVFLSYGLVMALGLGVVKETASLITGQYFKRKRENVEMIVLSGVGAGIAICSATLKALIQSIKWRLGLHALTGTVFLTFFLGIFYRSASLYHPQRRAILHLKNQRRKVKDKNTLPFDKPPLLDFTTLRARTLRIIMLSAAFCSFGLYTPSFYLVYIAEEEGLGNGSIYLLQTFMGLAFILGCLTFGCLMVKNSNQCLIARQYLCQTSIYGLTLSILALGAVEGFKGYVLFVWIYGIFLGAFHYSLKMFVFEKVRARNFNRAWGFVQWSQAIPVALGIPVSSYINVTNSSKTGLFFSAACLFTGGTVLFLMGFKQRTLKAVLSAQDSTRSSECDDPPPRNPLQSTESLLDDPDILALINSGGIPVVPGTCPCGNSLYPLPASPTKDKPAGGNLAKCQRAISFATSVDVVEDDRRADYLTCISEEGLIELADRDFIEEWRDADFMSKKGANAIQDDPIRIATSLTSRIGGGDPTSPNRSPPEVGRNLYDDGHEPGCPCATANVLSNLYIPKRTMTVIDEVTSTL